jgi:alkylation response protein AidB-like acyl-CoA dehydrogenase
MISFSLSEDQVLIRDTVRDLASAQLRPRIREAEAAGRLPEDVARSMHEMGLSTLALPESCGGQGLPLVTSVIAEEELAHGDAAAALAAPGPGAAAAALLELGDDAQRRRWLLPFCGPDGWKRRGALAWSETGSFADPGMKTVARKDGPDWVIDGRKTFVVNGGVADVTVVVAQIDPAAGWRGLGAFVVAGDNPGLRAGARLRTLGLDAVHFGEVVFESCRVPAAARLGDGDPTEGLGRAFCRLALAGAARAVGLSRAAWELARDYCETRHAFGKPIGHFQAVAFTLADRLMDVDSARALVWKAASRWDAGTEARRDVAMAGAHAHEAAMRCADDSVQLHGGMGFMRDVPVEKMMRDAKTLALVGPSVEMLDQLAAAADLGAPLGPEILLPTPDVQAVFT